MESCLTRIGEFQERTFGSMTSGDSIKDIRRMEMMNEYITPNYETIGVAEK